MVRPPCGLLASRAAYLSRASSGLNLRSYLTPFYAAYTSLLSSPRTGIRSNYFSVQLLMSSVLTWSLQTSATSNANDSDVFSLCSVVSGSANSRSSRNGTKWS